jgi:hypothetical protein
LVLDRYLDQHELKVATFASRSLIMAFLAERFLGNASSPHGLSQTASGKPWCGSSGLHGMRFECHAKSLANSPENCRQIIHAWISLFGQHPMQAFARMPGLLGQCLETNRSVDQIAQDEPRDMRFAVKESGCRLIEHGLGEGWVVPRPVKGHSVRQDRPIPF